MRRRNSVLALNSDISSEGVPSFILPKFEDEVGEIERTQKHFDIKDKDFVRKFIERAQTGQLVRLSEEDWDRLENTDSHSDNILRGDWDAVAQCAEAQEVERDWRGIKARMQTGQPVHAPLIARRGDILHKVGGNTRLMVARALGVKPDVLIVDISDFQ